VVNTFASVVPLREGDVPPSGGNQRERKGAVPVDSNEVEEYLINDVDIEIMKSIVVRFKAGDASLYHC